MQSFFVYSLIAPFVINYILGTEVNVDSLWILGLAVIFVGVSNVFGILCLVRTSNEILFTKSVVIGSFVFVCLCLFFGLRGDFSLRNIFTVVALTELSVLAMTTYFVLRLKMIVAVYHDYGKTLKSLDENVTPIQVGAAISSVDLNILRDDIGKIFLPKAVAITS